MDEKQLTEKVMSKISLSKDKVNLEKHVVNLSKSVVDLSKKTQVELGAVTAQVVVILDYSGSMSTLYIDGTVQRTLNRLVPLGLTFDDNNSLDVFLFETRYKIFPSLNLSNYEHYVEKDIMKSGYDMGGTNYEPVLKAAIEHTMSKTKKLLNLFKKTPKSNDSPMFILFITDGENSDRGPTADLLRKYCEANVFIQFVGIGNSTFSFLESLDTLSGRTRDNTGFVRMENLNDVDDVTLYNNVLGEFANWLKGNQ